MRWQWTDNRFAGGPPEWRKWRLRAVAGRFRAIAFRSGPGLDCGRSPYDRLGCSA
jgi:hypothetical protein